MVLLPLSAVLADTCAPLRRWAAASTGEPAGARLLRRLPTAVTCRSTPSARRRPPGVTSYHQRNHGISIRFEPLCRLRRRLRPANVLREQSRIPAYDTRANSAARCMPGPSRPRRRNDLRPSIRARAKATQQAYLSQSPAAPATTEKVARCASFNPAVLDVEPRRSQCHKFPSGSSQVLALALGVGIP